MPGKDGLEQGTQSIDDAPSDGAEYEPHTENASGLAIENGAQAAHIHGTDGPVALDGGDAVDARHSQGMVYKPSGPITQHFGDEIHIHQGESLRDLELAYLDGLLERYEYWLDHYTPLAGIAEVRAAVKDGPRLDLPMPFIPREFETLAEHGFGERVEPKREQFDDLREAIAKRRRIILLGDPGSGKTTTLWRLAYDYALEAKEDENAPLPVFAPLGGYTDDGPFEGYLAHHLRGLVLHLDAYLASGRLVLLLDGLNEMPQAGYEKRVERIREALDRHPGGMAVVTCRALDYVVKLKDLQKVEVSPLDDERIRTFLHNYLGEAVGGRLFTAMRGIDQVSLLELCRNPYMLLMTAQVYAGRGGELPANRARMLAAFVDTLLKREEKRHREQWIERECLKDGLAALAYAMQEERGGGTTAERKWAVAQLCNIVPDRDAQRLLYLAAGATMLDIDDATVRFHHQLLQEYFVARFVVIGASYNELTHSVGRLEAGHWREVFVLTAGLLDNAEVFFDLFKQALDALVREETTIVQILNWARERAAVIDGGTEPVAVRSLCLFCALDRAFVSARYGWRFVAFAPHSHDFDSDFTLTYALYPARNLAYDLASILVRDHASVRDLASDVGKTECKWNLTTGQALLLTRYLKACHLYVECLAVAKVSNREEIENRLLLPPEVKS